MKLSELKIGEKAEVMSVENSDLGLRLMEMGLMPGEIVHLDFVAPLGDPIAISVSDYHLSIRKLDAESITIKKVNN